jgi:histidine triad (HIT) family protein
MPPTIFSDIISHKIPAHIIYEDDKHIAFLDINPISPGHTLIVPKKEIDYIFDLDDSALADLHIFSKKIAKALKEAMQAERIVVLVEGFEIPHAHIHLIPAVKNMQSIPFNKPKINFDNITLDAVKEKIIKFVKF